MTEEGSESVGAVDDNASVSKRLSFAARDCAPQTPTVHCEARPPRDYVVCSESTHVSDSCIAAKQVDLQHTVFKNEAPCIRPGHQFVCCSWPGRKHQAQWGLDQVLQNSTNRVYRARNATATWLPQAAAALHSRKKHGRRRPGRTIRERARLRLIQIFLYCKRHLRFLKK